MPAAVDVQDKFVSREHVELELLELHLQTEVCRTGAFDFVVLPNSNLTVTI